ncbi:F-box only protein 40-like isoform X2 [Cottoperca gobio]|uniref:F-box only protein 40-like isoform X2 n=1 Tax=Cottoperca gobio TaxID=56716 RepID=A0A6J2R3Z1_COTGO|nr:F-box only protein 40-like isoform X2 [Cottoperca gobio]
MSQRTRAPKVRQHVHCDSCYSRRCRARVEASVCCAVIPCRLVCGALFHLCKEEDHLLLCPNVRVPCLNVEYGCPLHMPRSSQAAHLQVCPASVVFCSMEWNRWPANDAHSYPNTELHENLIREREKGGCLDLAMALKDQDLLFHSMKMKKLFPELIQTVEEDKEEDRREEERRKEKRKQKKEAAEKAAKEASLQSWESLNMFEMCNNDDNEDENEDEVEVELTQEEREAIARGTGVNEDLLENYNAWESMFTMEMGGCREAVGAAVAGRDQRRSKGREIGLSTQTEEDAADTCVGATASNISTSSSCLAGKPKKEFVYGHVEPMKIITVRTFKTPTSFSARNVRIRNPNFYKRERRAVDTSDLGVALEDMPVWEEVQASLLCSLEKEQRGHLIAESVCTDGLLQDEGTQTYNFLSAPFLRETSLADLTAAKPLELHLQLQVESVTSRHHKASSAFTFLCGHTFQRREYGKHYKNVHSDIQMGVNGWFEQRCPLAYLGCTYSQRRLQPSTHEATVSYNHDLGCFNLHPNIPVFLGDASQPSGTSEDSLSLLPYEVLCHMERGMVTLHWEKKTYSHGGAKWRVKQMVWQFSTLFSPVDAWCFQNVPSLSEHLKVCPCYERESRTEKIHLPRIREEEVQTKTSCNGPALVTMFHQRITM